MKRWVALLLMVLLAITVTCCKKQLQENETGAEPVSYREELEKVVCKEQNMEFVYHKEGDYSHVLHIKEVNTTPELTIVKAEGVMMDNMDIVGDTVFRNFEVEYVIDDKSIREIIRNHDMYKSDGNMETVHSIIPNQIILQGPLAEGNLWFQPFVYNGKEMKAQTTLVSIAENEDGKKIYKTETVVENIEGFPEKTYKEIRIYEEGKGLVYFQNTLQTDNNQNDVLEYKLDFARKVEPAEENK